MMLAALVGCGATVRIDPEASEKRYLLGADYFAKGAMRPALEELLSAVTLNPRNPEAHDLLGILFLRQAAEAEEMSQRSSCVTGEEARLNHDELEAKFRSAEEQFRLATMLRPEYSDAWNNLAVVQLHAARWDDAVTSTTHALSNLLYSDPWAAQGNLGWAYFHKKDLVKAGRELKAALFRNPKFCVGRYRLARVLLEQQDLAGAQAELDRLTTEKTCPIQEAFHLLGVVSLRRGDPAGRAAATEAFRRCVELAPQSCLARECRIVN